MSNFCTNCGGPISPENTLCPACGTPVAAAAVSAAPPAAPAAGVPPPVYTQPAYSSTAPTIPPPQNVQGGSALKIILIIVGVFVLLGALGAGVVGFGIWRVSRAVHVDSKSGEVSVATPTGTFSSGSRSSISAADLGVDIYPGAIRGEGSMNIKSPEGSMVSAVYTTRDSISQVVDFYKSKLGDQASTVETGNATLITSAQSEKDKIMVTATQESDGTRITIIHNSQK